MSILDFFRARKKAPTASVAKERLQIIVAHERGQRDEQITYQHCKRNWWKSFVNTSTLTTNKYKLP